MPAGLLRLARYSLGIVAMGSGSVAAQPLAAERVLAVADGLSGSVVGSVTVDATGFLWVGTQQGLDRWDGVRLVPTGIQSDVVALSEAPDGALWAGGRDGVWLVGHGDARPRRLRDSDRPDGPLAGPVRALLADGDGGLWIGTRSQGLLHARPGRSRYGRVHGLPSDSVRTLLRPERAPAWLWVGTSSGLVRVHQPSGRVAPAIRPAGDATPVTACADAGRLVWCGTRAGGLYALDVRTGHVVRQVSLGAEISALALSATRRGTLWVGTRGMGLRAIDLRTGGVAPALAADERLDRADVLAVAEDASGLLWVGAFGGLYRADTRPPPFAPGPALEGAPPVTTLHVPDAQPNVLWLGTIRGGLTRLDRRTGEQRRWFDDPRHLISVVLALHTDVQGAVWLAGPDAVLTRLDPATGDTLQVPLGATPNTVVYHLAPDPAQPSLLWASTADAGLLEVDTVRRRVRRRWNASTPGRGRLDAEVVWTSRVHPDDPGTRWLATRPHGLLRLDLRRGTVTAAGDGCGLGAEVHALAPAPGGVLWVGTNRGALVRYDVLGGRCRAYDVDDGRPSAIYALTIDRSGSVWATTRTAGLLRLDPTRGTWTRFTTADGLPSDEFYIPAHDRAASGAWTVGGPNGWTSFQPDSVGVRLAPPRVVVTGLRVDGQPSQPPHDGVLRLGPSQNDIGFEFAALDLRRPAANRYRMRLTREGEAAGPWSALGARTDVRFPYLAAGGYRFQVAGAGPAGRWNEAEPVAFVIRPPLWRRPGFWTLVALGVAAGVGLVQQARIRSLRRLEATRRRIADDLHDDIGSKMSTVALRLDLAGRSPALSEADRTRLAQLAGTARGVVDSLRDSVWVVDAGHDSLAALVDRIETAAETMLAGRSHRVERPPALPDVRLPMETRRHVVLWTREALNNALKHGQGIVRVRIALTGDSLQVRVEDEGPGFAPGACDARGRGQSTLAQRAAAVGGHHTIETAPGQPTRVALTVPLRPAAGRRNGLV